MRSVLNSILIAIVLITMGCGGDEGKQESVTSIAEAGENSASEESPIAHGKWSETKFSLDTNQHYRGLFTKGDTIIISGSSGHVAVGRVQPEGITWENNFNVDSLHLRDVEFSAQHIHVLSIGTPGYLKSWRAAQNDPVASTWNTQYFNADSSVFMDGMDFWENGAGLVYGDPLDGYHFVLKTQNHGREWTRVPSDQLPSPLKDEAGFAASGTGVVCMGKGTAYIGWGGEKARLFKTTDYGETWEAIETPLARGSGKGIYSMAWKNELEGVVAGGSWEDPSGDSCCAFTKDGGRTWTLSQGGSGYRSGVCYVQDDMYLSVGTNGTDISRDGGLTWNQMNKENLNAIQPLAEIRSAVAVGSKGKGLLIRY